MGVDSDADGNFDDGTIGDIVNAPQGSPIGIQVRILGAKGEELTILDSRAGGSAAGRMTDQRPIESDDEIVALEQVSSGNAGSFLVLWVGGREALANPLWY